MPDPRAATQSARRALDSQNQSQTRADTLPKPEQTIAATEEPGNLPSNDAVATISQTSPAAGESNLVSSNAGVSTENASTVDTATSTTMTTTAGTSSASTTSTTTIKVKSSVNPKGKL